MRVRANGEEFCFFFFVFVFGLGLFVFVAVFFFVSVTPCLLYVSGFDSQPVN